MMSDLKVANVQRCLSILREFQDAVPVEDSNETLKEQKKRAGAALEHLSNLFKGEPDEIEVAGGDCPNCKINVTIIE